MILRFQIEVKQAMNEAANYGVRIVPAVIPPGGWYWKAIRVRHLSGAENHGQHNVFINALNVGGGRALGTWAGWTWEGKQPGERADPVALDKPPTDFAMGNLAMHWGQIVSVWMIGADRLRPDASDRVENMHTAHPDEEAGNTRGHHSFEVDFQWVEEGEKPPEPEPPIPPTPGPEYKTWTLPLVSKGDEIAVGLTVKVKRW